MLGFDVGPTVGSDEGSIDGATEGGTDGRAEGNEDGTTEGSVLGRVDGNAVGALMQTDDPANDIWPFGHALQVPTINPVDVAVHDVPYWFAGQLV